ncbi:MAG: polysaccharide biosynthesis tyrosine autokinase [Ruminococcaceae bacterium]|nr:polysaccharide biosynthesis tyrosine autokinase [Oscillospiraceae bacterium]
MEEKVTTQNNEELEIDLRRIFEIIWNKLWLIVVVGIVGAAAAFAVTHFFITPQYQSAAMFYVNNNSLSVGDASLSISSSDIVASKSLVDTYIVILNTRETLNDVIDYADVDRSYAEVKGMLSAEPVNETEIFQIVVTSPDPVEAENIASAIAYILPKRISSIIEGTSAKIVDTAVVPVSPSSPSYPKNTMLGCMLGVLLTVMAIVLYEVFDVTIRTEDDITKRIKYPVLASVPDMENTSRSGYYKSGYYYYGYGNRKKNQKNKRLQSKEKPALIGGQISFSASEAYKLLRTKLQFSFADEIQTRIIGVSSALAGEGKSLTSANLAYSLSELGKKVLLIDCDMRRPSLDTKLTIQKTPGLSDYLTGQCSVTDVFQPCGLPESENAFSVIAAGRNPPNPIELLSSARMSELLKSFRDTFDYVVLDLPPVMEVSDAMAVAKETDGILLVVRQNHGNNIVLNSVVREFEFVGAKLLGVVFNCTQDSGGSYYSKYYRRYYGRYYKRYYRSYEGRHEKTGKSSSSKTKNDKNDQ